MLATRVAAREVVGKKRKQRSDKGKTRKKKSSRKGGDAGDNNSLGGKNEDIGQTSGGGRPLKKKCKMGGVVHKLPPTSMSQEFIDSDSEDDNLIDDEDSDV